MSEESGPDAEPDRMANETDDSYFIEGDWDTIGHLTACNKCGRKILVQLALFGVQHHAGITVICGECLVMPDQFRQEHPKIVTKIENWLKDVQENKQDQS